MADREHEVGAVHGVEVEGIDAALGELLHLAGRDRRRDQLARFRIVVEAFEFFAPASPAPWCRALGHEVARLLEIVHRHDAGHDRNIDAARADAIEIAKVEVVVEEDLGDGAGRAGIDLGLQDIDVGIDVGLSGCFSG